MFPNHSEPQDRDDEAGTEIAPVEPWLAAHAPLEDQALGIELELIELVRQRGEAWGAAERRELAGEIDRATDRLACLAARPEAPWIAAA